MKKSNSSLRVYGIVLAISLFLIFFVGRVPSTEDNGQTLAIVGDGLNHFAKGMDVAGGVSLTYKIDLTKYQQVYTDDAEYTRVVKGVKDLILQRIDDRISTLGVSDYNSFIQSLDDGEYVVIEIGGVSDLDQAKEIIGKTVELEFKIANPTSTGTGDQRILATDPKTGELLNGSYFQLATVSSSQTGQPVVVITFDEKGGEIFCNLTEQNVGNQIAIFVGNELKTAPVIRDRICGGSTQIDGDFTGTECGADRIPAKDHITGTKCLVDNLNEGAFPAPLILSQEEKVSAVLGEQALTGALIAAGVGLAMIYVFMIVMYGFRQGTVALLTLLSFIIVLLGLTKLLQYAFSLSGIAAILLSLGMGVDANVLIYERVREEREKGLNWSEAIHEGYTKSYSAIRDGNVTTLMIAILLFFLGTNVFKGFGTMMMINILLTLAVIVPMTKLLLEMMYSDD